MLERFEEFTFTIYQIQRLWNKIAAAGMEKYGLKGAYVVYLLALRRRPAGLTAAELGKICGRDKADVSRAVAVMESKGIIVKKPGSGSLYRAKLQLSEQGSAMAEEVCRQAEYAESAASAGLSEPEREALNRALKTVKENLTNLEKSGIPQPSAIDPALGIPKILPIY